MTTDRFSSVLERVTAANELASHLSRPDLHGIPDWYDGGGSRCEINEVCDRLAEGTWLVRQEDTDA